MLATWYISADMDPNFMLFQGGNPVLICSTVQPTLQMSAFRPCPVCVITSGAMKYGVPRRDMLSLCRVASVPLSCLLAPKSASLTVPLSSIRMLAPLMSLWTTRLACRKCNPWRICGHRLVKAPKLLKQ